MPSVMQDVMQDGGSPWALADRLVHAIVAARVLGTAEDAVTLGRYQIERPLGTGSMGHLLLAFDPKLERRVALKLIAPHLADSAEARERIVQEARAMAQLSDPHVAQVYEVDEADGRLFVALEYVDGEDLRAWLDGETRSWRQVVEMFLQAGSGLAAAHDKGIVHRDFKPDNVVLERDGRARVVDFGLALAGAHRGLAGDGFGEADELAQTESSWGTPAYMAPEQWTGTANATSDQFAFCVALFDALAKRQPYAGDTIEEIRAAVEAGRLEALPRNVPRWIARALRRGLAPDPASRWPDMRTLLRALDPARRMRTRSLIAGGVVLVALAALAAYRSDPCSDADTPMVANGGNASWGSAQREAVVASLASRDDLPWAETTARPLIAHLDVYAATWGQAARAVCATPDAPPGSADCLELSRRRVDDVVGRALGNDPALLVGVVGDAELLPDLRACLEAPSPALHDAGVDPAAIEEAWTQVLRLERTLGAMSVGAADAVAAVEEGTTLAREAIALSERTHHVPVLARALWSAGRLQLRDGDPSGAEVHLRRALALAHATGDVPLSAAVLIELVYVLSRDRDRTKEAEALAAEAAGMLIALGDPPVLAARLRSHRASVMAHARVPDPDAAVTLHEQAVALLDETLGSSHPETITAIGNLGSALNYANRPAEAQAQLTRAIAAAERTWGDANPRTAVFIGALGLAHLRQGDLEQAEVDLRRSLAIRQAIFGADHAEVDSARYNLASALRRSERHGEAIALLELGLDHRRRELGPEASALAPWLVAIGESRLALGEDAAAGESLSAALRLFERSGALASDYARVRWALARALAKSDPSRARMLAESAREDADGSTRQAEIEAWLSAL